MEYVTLLKKAAASLAHLKNYKDTAGAVERLGAAREAIKQLSGRGSKNDLTKAARIEKELKSIERAISIEQARREHAEYLQRTAEKRAKDEAAANDFIDAIFFALDSGVNMCVNERTGLLCFNSASYIKDMITKAINARGVVAVATSLRRAHFDRDILDQMTRYARAIYDEQYMGAWTGEDDYKRQRYILETERLSRILMITYESPWAINDNYNTSNFDEWFVSHGITNDFLSGVEYLRTKLKK